MQDKNKYKTPKYRFVVRFTNKDIMCQVFSSDITHDICMGAAYSHELRRYGINLGLTNYASAYCTGLLLARRINKKLGLDELYEGNTEDVGEYYEVEPEDERNPFCCILDVGLKPTSTGSRLFGALKGACDGGLDIPHGDRRFPRPKSDGGKDYEADPEFHRKYIFAGHVAEYMNKLKDDDEEAYKKQFSRFIKAGIEPEDLEELYKKAHEQIRAEPNRPRGPLELGRHKTRKAPKKEGYVQPHKRFKCHPPKLTLHQRKKRVLAKLARLGKKQVSREPNSSKKKRVINTVKFSKSRLKDLRRHKARLKLQGQLSFEKGRRLKKGEKRVKRVLTDYEKKLIKKQRFTKKVRGPHKGACNSKTAKIQKAKIAQKAKEEAKKKKAEEKAALKQKRKEEKAKKKAASKKLTPKQIKAAKKAKAEEREAEKQKRKAENAIKREEAIKAKKARRAKKAKEEAASKKPAAEE